MATRSESAPRSGAISAERSRRSYARPEPRRAISALSAWQHQLVTAKFLAYIVQPACDGRGEPLSPACQKLGVRRICPSLVEAKEVTRALPHKFNDGRHSLMFGPLNAENRHISACVKRQNAMSSHPMIGWGSLFRAHRRSSSARLGESGRLQHAASPPLLC